MGQGASLRRQIASTELSLKKSLEEKEELKAFLEKYESKLKDSETERGALEKAKSELEEKISETENILNQAQKHLQLLLSEKGGGFHFSFLDQKFWLIIRLGIFTL
eukprot:Sdes_comp15940_c0_seq1m5084